MTHLNPARYSAFISAFSANQSDFSEEYLKLIEIDTLTKKQNDYLKLLADREANITKKETLLIAKQDAQNAGTQLFSKYKNFVQGFYGEKSPILAEFLQKGRNVSVLGKLITMRVALTAHWADLSTQGLFSLDILNQTIETIDAAELAYSDAIEKIKTSGEKLPLMAIQLVTHLKKALLLVESLYLGTENERKYQQFVIPSKKSAKTTEVTPAPAAA